MRAFSVTAAATPLPGGNEQTWVADEIVLKPIRSGHLEEAEWIAGLLSRTVEDGFRVAKPRAAVDGRWVTNGWTAWGKVQGQGSGGRIEDLVDALDAFHRSFVDVPRPGFLDSKTDRWSVADRVAWEDLPSNAYRVKGLAELVRLRRPFSVVNQVVHSDPWGNALFSDGLPPAFIDFSPFWRPSGYSAAMAVVNELTWNADVPDSALSVLRRYRDWRQLFLRAVIFRIVTDQLRRGPDAEWLGNSSDPFSRVVLLAHAAVEESS